MQLLRVVLRGLDRGVELQSRAKLVYLTSAHPEDENTFEEPDKVGFYASGTTK